VSAPEPLSPALVSAPEPLLSPEPVQAPGESGPAAAEVQNPDVSGGPSAGRGTGGGNGVGGQDDADDAGTRPGGVDDVTEPDAGEDHNPSDPDGSLRIMGPEIGSYTLVPEITGLGTPGSTVTLLELSGDFLGLTTVGADGTWAITPTALEAGTVEFVAVTGDSVSETLGPYEFLAPDLELTTLGADIPATATASDGSPVATVEGRIRGIAGQSARMMLDDDQVSPWYQFGSRAFTMQFANVCLGEHTLTARYVDPATGRVGAARTLALTVSALGATP
jgi:hypothetical protein